MWNATSLLTAEELRMVQKFKWLLESFNSVSQSCVAVQQLCSPWLRHNCQKSHKPQLTCFVLQPFPQLEIASSDCSIPVLTIFLGLWLISLFRACRIIHIKITPSSEAWFERLEVWGFYCRGLCKFQDVGLGSFYWWGTQWQPGDFPDLFGTRFSLIIAVTVW